MALLTAANTLAGPPVACQNVDLHMLVQQLHEGNLDVNAALTACFSDAVAGTDRWGK